MEERQITDERTWKLPPTSCPCSLLGPLLAILVPYHCRPLPVVFNLSVVSAMHAVCPRPSFYLPCPRKFERKRYEKSREPSRTNGSARTGTKENNLLMVLERSQWSCQEQMQWWFFEG
ncbi:hypothetical protein OUZ56_032210 [Daphnia magna]|uniref:Uncharacterized protein n=1 Tax=Daphnia magna TaxID=35525 RepID=A0ABQ9ZWH2_9CRUS|nr:hypothetical protein OUZ56_032210 [Daphnia magna]